MVIIDVFNAIKFDNYIFYANFHHSLLLRLFFPINIFLLPLHHLLHCFYLNFHFIFNDHCFHCLLLHYYHYHHSYIHLLTNINYDHLFKGSFNGNLLFYFVFIDEDAINLTIYRILYYLTIILYLY